jgi:3-hydroxyacyl-CoA dehydrogenase/enoyl-CoA hydratase/3-hydroxybutyryl-CoA epimerase
MPLVEVIHSAQTEPQPLAAAMALRVDSTSSAAVSQRAGFLVNRVLFPSARSAVCSRRSVPLALIDRAAVEFGMPMGPMNSPMSWAWTSSCTWRYHHASCSGTCRRSAATARSGAARKLGVRVRASTLAGRQGGAPTTEGAPPPDLADRLILAWSMRRGVPAEQVIADADLLDAGVVFGRLCAVSRRPAALCPHARRAAVIAR